jgi:hypothetical protein
MSVVEPEVLPLFIFLSGRPWPVAFGTGIGLGMGYANCQNDFNHNVYPRGFSKIVSICFSFFTNLF